MYKSGENGTGHSGMFQPLVLGQGQYKQRCLFFTEVETAHTEKTANGTQFSVHFRQYGSGIEHPFAQVTSCVQPKRLPK